MSASIHYHKGDKVSDIYTTMHGIVEEVRACSHCGHPRPTCTGEGCLVVALFNGMVVERAPREVYKKSYGGER